MVNPKRRIAGKAGSTRISLQPQLQEDVPKAIFCQLHTTCWRRESCAYLQQIHIRAVLQLCRNALISWADMVLAAPTDQRQLAGG
jgi:hypothetical protein